LEQKRYQNAAQYINSHPSLDQEIKDAIVNGKVILGMNVCESIAAVGNPNDYYATDERYSPPRKYTIDSIIAQCDNPDSNILVYLIFRNSSQYGIEHTFIVKYINGIAVEINIDYDGK
jgi:hypothetical protein